MQKIRSHILFISIFFSTCAYSQSSEADRFPFLQHADSLNKTRVWIYTATGMSIYGTISIGLWEAWYKNEELSKFHFFNDWNEWERMDKIGHMFTAYNQSRWFYQGALWTGMKRRNALLIGSAIAFTLQGTVEVMDGFGKKWGFSIPDLGFNTLGIGFFAAQELFWQEQRITIKVSSTPQKYPNARIFSADPNISITLKERAEELFGSTYSEQFIKDYNAQTLWYSFNIQSFLPNRDSKIPDWLNGAIGYGVENVFEGNDDDYGWTAEQEDGTHLIFSRDPQQFPRYQQFYLAFDIDFTRIKTKSRFLKTFFYVVNFLKFPSPALEINSLGKVHFHPFYW